LPNQESCYGVRNLNLSHLVRESKGLQRSLDFGSKTKVSKTERVSKTEINSVLRYIHHRQYSAKLQSQQYCNSIARELVLATGIARDKATAKESCRAKSECKNTQAGSGTTQLLASQRRPRR
jgi:hypothetical protein